MEIATIRLQLDTQHLISSHLTKQQLLLVTYSESGQTQHFKFSYVSQNNAPPFTNKVFQHASIEMKVLNYKKIELHVLEVK